MKKGKDQWHSGRWEGYRENKERTKKHDEDQQRHCECSVLEQSHNMRTKIKETRSIRPRLPCRTKKLAKSTKVGSRNNEVLGQTNRRQSPIVLHQGLHKPLSSPTFRTHFFHHSAATRPTRHCGDKTSAAPLGTTRVSLTEAMDTETSRSALAHTTNSDQYYIYTYIQLYRRV